MIDVYSILGRRIEIWRHLHACLDLSTKGKELGKLSHTV